MTDVEWDDTYCEVMRRKYAESNMSNFEVLGIGAAVLSWVSTVGRLGHTSPASTLDYTGSIDDLSGLIVRDFVAWSSGRLNTVPGDPAVRLKQLIETGKWDDVQLAKINRFMRGAA